MAILASDTFTRVNQSGWGTASDGESWSHPVGTSNLNIASNQGTISGVATNSNVLFLGSNTVADAELLARFSLTNTSAIAGTLLRATASNTFYMCRFNSGALQLYKFVTGVSTQLATASFTVIVSTLYWIRFRVVATNLYGKIWADSGGEPAGWTLTVSDAAISAAGQYGFRANTATISSDTITYDSLTVTAVVALTSTLSGAGSLSGTLTVPGAALTGECDGIGTLSGTLSLATALATTLPGVGTLAGTWSLATALSVTEAGIGTLTGTLSASGTVALAGTLAGVGTLAGTLSLSTALTGATAGVGTLSGALSVSTALSLSLSGTGTLAGSLSASLALTSATLSGVGTLSGTVGLLSALSVNVAGGGQLTGTLSLSVALFVTFAGVGLLVPTLSGGTTVAIAVTTTWVTRDLQATWVTRDDQTTWTTRR